MNGAVHRRPRRPGGRTALAVVLAFALWPALVPEPARAEAPWTPAVLAKTDPGVVHAFTSRPGEPVAVWVAFADKGERGPAGRADLLARAEAALSPRARTRRERTRRTSLVDMADVPVHAPYLEALRAAGAAPYGVSRWFNQAAVRVTPETLARLAALPFVTRLRAVERASRMPIPEPGPAMPFARHDGGAGARAAGAIDYGQAFAQVQQLNVPAVHDSGYIGTGVLVCLLDAGFNLHQSHEAFATLDVPPGHRRDFVDGDTVVTGGFDQSHGTWVLGCIGANRPGTYVGSGFGATFALARTENASSETTSEMVNWLMGAEWADSLGADIISSSLGYFLFDNPNDDLDYSDFDGRTTIVSRAAEIAAASGILVVNSAGNAGNDPSWNGKILAPADVHGDSLIAIAAVDAAGVRASFSSKGPTADGRIKPDLAARGVANPLVSSSSPTGYFSGSDTSFSAPLVAGLAACLMQARPAWTPTEVIRALRETASRATTPDTLLGYGIPNGLRALQWPESAASVPPPSGGPRIALLGPNPLRSDGPPARVRFALPANAPAGGSGRVRVFDGQGRLVRTLWSGGLAAGTWLTADWDGRDHRGERRAGLYFIAFETAGTVRSVRIVSLP